MEIEEQVRSLYIEKKRSLTNASFLLGDLSSYHVDS
jgi:hypothetical protein